MTRVTVGTRNPSVQTENRGSSSVSAATQSDVNTGSGTGYVIPSTLQGRIDTDGTLAANSDVKIPSQKAVKTYVDANGGGGISGLTANRVPYAASATSLTDSVSLSWDNSDLKLTIGTHFVKSHATGIYIGKNLGTVGMNTGIYNVVIGEDLGLAFTTATRNILIGHDAGRAITSAQYNIAIGEAALRLSTTAGENVGIGYRALYAATGEDNVGIGFAAGQSFADSGRDNIFLGYYAGSPAVAGVPGVTDYTAGWYSIFIGSQTSTDAGTEGGQINIGNVFFARNNTATNPVPFPQTGDVGIFVPTPTARVHIPASTTSKASFRIPHGTAPTSPNDGDMWTTTAGLYVRINGSTIGPLS